MSRDDAVLFQAAFLQFVPHGASAERVNLGVVAYSPQTRELAFRFLNRFARIGASWPSVDVARLRELVAHLSARASWIARHGRGGLSQPDAEPTIETLLHGIIPEGSLNFVWSPILRGVAPSVRRAVDEVYRQQVEHWAPVAKKQRRDDADLWRDFTGHESFRPIASVIGPGVQLSGPDYSYRFKTGWQNGRQQVAEPISLDYVNPSEAVEKASLWAGRLFALQAGPTDFSLTPIVTEPPAGNRKLYDQAVRILEKAPRVRLVLRESQVAHFVGIVRGDLDEHALERDNAPLLATDLAFATAEAVKRLGGPKA